MKTKKIAKKLTKTRKNNLSKKTFFIVVIVVLLFGIFAFAKSGFLFSHTQISNTNPSEENTQSSNQNSFETPTSTPFRLGAADLFSTFNFVKRDFDANEKIKGLFKSINVYPSEMQSVLGNVPDNDLIAIKCAPWIGFSKWEDSYYYSINGKTYTLYDKKIMRVIKQVNSLVIDNSIVNGYFICQTDDGRIILNFATYPSEKEILNRTYHFVQIDTKSS